MPEGDTVWLTARRLDQALRDRQLTVFDLRVPQLATLDLRGSTVREVIARGKHILTRLDSQLTLHSHLKMDGSWYLTRSGSRPHRYPDHMIRAQLGNADWLATGYRVHDLALLPTADEAALVGHLGPDLLGPDWDLDEALRRLHAAPDVAIGEALLDQRNRAGIRNALDTSLPIDLQAALAANFWLPQEAIRRLLAQPERTIGEALLDQRNVAGIGTVYRAEVLFLRGVNPWTPTGAVPELDELLVLARRLMMANRERPAQVTTGDNRRGHEHWVYGRSGDPCRRCGTTIQRGSQGPVGMDRVIYWCSSCQPRIR